MNYTMLTVTINELYDVTVTINELCDVNCYD